MFRSKIKILLAIAVLLLCSTVIRAQYHSLCWQVTGHGPKHPSYLYGTMHVSDPKVFHFTKAVLDAFHGVRVFAMELDPEQMMDVSVLARMVMPEGMTIHHLIPDTDYHYVDSILIAHTGMGVALYDKMSPVIVESMLELYGTANIGDTNDHHIPLDLYLYRESKKRHQKIVGIETADEQITALQSLSYTEQAELLMESIAEMRRPHADTISDIVNVYVRGNLDSLLQMSDESKMPTKFYKAIVTDRNIRMADRIGKLIGTQTCFIAIGALHLPGEGGVIELLRRAGYMVKEYR